MAIEVDFRVADGVRLDVPRRGPRRPVGPAVARTDGDEPDEPARRLAALSGGGRRTPVGHDPAGATVDGFTGVQAHLDALTTLHHEPVEAASPPVVSGSADAGRARGRLVRWWRARRAADHRAGEEPEPRGRGHLGGQRQADAWWERLCANDPRVLVGRLVLAFERAGFGAAVAATGSEGTADLVLAVEPAEPLVGRWESPDGDTPIRMPRPRRHELHRRVIGSAVVALAAEAFAVAPGLAAARVAVLQPDRPERRPAVLALAHLAREQVLPAGEGRPAVDDLEHAADEGRAVLELRPRGPAGALVPLDPDEPTVRRLLDVLALR